MIETQFILALDVVSHYPKVSLSNIFTKDTICQNLRREHGRYEAEHFIDQIYMMARSLDCSAQQIKAFAYTGGPGPFSPLRVAAILARLLYRANEEKEEEFAVYKFSFLHLLYMTLRPSEDSLYLPLAKDKFLCESYDWQGNIRDNAHSVNQVKSSEGLLCEPEKLPDLQLNEMMIQLILESKAEAFRVSSIERITPDYFREVSVTCPRNNKQKSQ